MKTVVIVGVGALGSHLVQFLRNEEVTFKLIDFDRIERRNTKSQFHVKSGVGKVKVQALGQLMQFLWGLKVQTVPHKLTSENDDQLLSGADLIIDCLDNGQARRIVQGFARRTHTPCLHGALAADGGFGQIIWDKDFKIDNEDVVGAATCEEGNFLPFITLVSSYMAQATQEFLSTGKKIGFQVHGGGANRM
jgi:molybdopterin-synthase adenylyltransferase